MIPSVKKYSKKELNAFKKRGRNVFNQFEFELFDNKLYVAKNNSNNKNIQVGSEVVDIDGRNSQEMLQEYNKLFTSDGYNTTFKKNTLARIISRFYTYENGLKDSIKFKLKFKDVTEIATVLRKPKDTTGDGKLKKMVYTDLQKEENKAKAKALKTKKDVEGYDKETKEYRRNLRFIEKDSSIAVIKIRGFTLGDYKTFYEESFQKIKDYNAKTLVIDLRNNGGGRLAEIENLYKYLSEKDFQFTQDSQVASKTSLMQMDYFKGSWYWLPLKIAVAPISYSIMYLVPSKKEDGKYYVTESTKPTKIKENAFKGKIYVLINGGSFSASSVISSNLHGSKRATFVGEETGGAYNGTVAGLMPLEKIPNSDLKLRVGLLACIPYYQTEKEGRGIFPDKEIIPTLQDRIDGVDPELNWVLDDIKKINNNETATNK